MSKKWSRIVCMLFCALMLCSMLYAVQQPASAAEVDKVIRTNDLIARTQTETVTETVEVRSRTPRSNALGTDEYGDITFETFADLKELCSRSYDTWTFASCAVGAGEFIISEDIVVPEFLQLYFYGNNAVKIQKGVTVTAHSYVSLWDLIIDGTYVIDESALNVMGGLTVNGALNCSGSLYLSGNASLVGFDKITLTGPYPYIARECNAFTEEEVYEALAAAAKDTVFEYNIYVNEPMTLQSDITIPANAQLVVYGALTMNGTCTVDGQLYTWKEPITVNGKLVNNSYVTLDSATLTFGSGASYSGTGIICVVANSPENVLAGISLDDFSIENWGGSYELTYIGDKTRLGSPTDLTWGMEHGYTWDPDTDTRVEDPSYDRAVPGLVSFKRADLDQGEYYLALYKVGQEVPIDTFGIGLGSYTNAGEWVDEYLFLESINESGQYYFTVRAEGDGIEYIDGPTVTSDVWTYTKPAQKLAAPTGLTWEWPEAVFSTTETDETVYGYSVEFYHTTDLSKEPVWAGSSHFGSFFDNRADVYDWVLQNSGLGYYSFKVRLTSNDITKIANSDWSEMSPAYNLTQLSQDVETELGKIDITASAEEIRDAVQSLDTEELKAAMLADKGNFDVVSDLYQLEEAVGGPAEVSVSQEAAAFDASKVSIIGANLNNAASESEPITLVLDKPEKEHVLDTLYNSSVAVSFSMDLDNVEDTENLAVPVKITLPVPSTINPNFLVILHYHADGTVEEVHPYIFNEGQWYAEFVLTSFSDFVMTEFAQEEPEDPEVPDDPEVKPDDPEVKPDEPAQSFKDVPANAFFYEAVMWAVENGVTTGTGADTFSPNAICTRGQVVTFLWRAAGEPEPTETENPFVDVKESDFFYKAVLWAKEKGITSGTGDGTTFEPNANCNRGQIVTFLSRAKDGQPSATVNPFKDVKESDFFYKAVLWAKEKGITTGTGDGTTFEPNANCTRGQVITFLWRAYTK